MATDRMTVEEMIAESVRAESERFPYLLNMIAMRAREDEREACAKLAEETAKRAQGTEARNDIHKARLNGEMLAATEIAMAIGARK